MIIPVPLNWLRFGWGEKKVAYRVQQNLAREKAQQEFRSKLTSIRREELTEGQQAAHGAMMPQQECSYLARKGEMAPPERTGLPSAADLDAVVEEERIKQYTSKPKIRWIQVEAHFNWELRRTEFLVWCGLQCRHVLIGYRYA